MPSIDERVVSMAFENAKFEANLAVTMASLKKLDDTIKSFDGKTGLENIEKAGQKVNLEHPMSALDKLKARLSGVGSGAADGMSEIEKAGNKVTLDQPIKALSKVQSATADVGRGAVDGFNEIEKAAGRVSLQGLNAAMDSVTAKFSVMQGAATVALGNITSQAVMKGGAFAKSFALGPITDGLNEYKTNLSSIQTILANTQGQKVSGLDNVNKALQDLNHYSDQTIYNFSEMAKNIGTFTAAGVDLPKATQSIKGIANLAALSGSNSQQASTAMYQLSQAISAGRVGLQDWNSVVNAGMGGAVFQKSLMRTAENMGALAKGAVHVDEATGKATVNGKSFRESMMAKPGQTSWLTSDVLVETLKQFTGDMKEADLIAQGFSKDQASAIMQQAKTAKAAATEVKTLSQVFDVAKETIGSGWAQTFQNVFGNFGEAKKTFTAMSNAINGFINSSSNARNKVLGDWKALGGRTDLINGLKDAFHALSTILSVVGQAFRSIFPAQTGKDLADFTHRFAEFAQKLQPSHATIIALRKTFAGLFAVLHIGWSIIKGVVGVIGDLLGVVGHGSGGFLSFTGSIGDFLVAIDQALTKGGLLKSFFKTLSDILQVPMKMIMGISSGIAGLFGGMDGNKVKGFTDSLNGVAAVVTPFEQATITLKKAWADFVDILSQAKDLVSPWLDKIGNAVSDIVNAIGHALQGENFGKAMSILQTTFIGGIFLALKKAITGGATEFSAAFGGVNKVLGALTGNLQAMQKNVQATVILKIAGAIGILAAGIYVLSTVDPKRLASAMTAIAVGLGQLIAAMKIMTSGVGKAAIVQVPILAASLVMMATSVTILAGAMKIFSTMDWTGIAKGLAGIGGGLAAIGIGMKFLGPGTLIQGPAILILAIALNVLALAVKQFATMKWGDLAKGIAGVGVSLAAIGVAMSLMPPTLLIMGPGLVAVAFALNLLAASISVFAGMDLLKMYQGILGVAGALAAIGVSISLIPPTVALQAAGLVILGVALTGIATAIGIFGKLGILTLVKGLAALAASLVILSVGLYAMTGTLPGAAALLVAAGALAILAPALGFLGTLKWSTIFKGLVAIALALGTLSIVGALAGPGLVTLGTSLLPLAGVFFVTAAAVFLFAKALALLGASGGKGITVMVTALTAFIALLPKIIIDLVKGLVEVVDSIVTLAPKIVAGLQKVLDIVIAFVIEAAPKLAIAVGSLVDMIVTVIWDSSPKLIAAGFKLLLDFLSGIDNNIGQVVSRVGGIVVKFLGGLAEQAPKIVAAGAKMLAAYLDGIANNFYRVIDAAGRVVVKFIEGVATKLPHVVTAGGDLIVSFLRSLSTQVPRVIRAGGDLIVSYIDGIGKELPRIVKAGAHLIGRFIHGIGEAAVDLANAAFETVTTFLNGLARVIRERGPELRAAGWNLADAILNGIVDGFKQLGHKAVDAIGSVITAMPKKALELLGIHSPSKVFQEIGQNIMVGLSNGLMANSSNVNKTLGSSLKGMIDVLGNGKEIGQFLSREFAKGLTGDKSSIRDAFAGLRGKLKEEQDKLREQVKTDRDQLTQLMEAEHPDQAKVNKAYASYIQNETLLQASRVATANLMRGLQDEKKHLLDLADDFDKVSKKLDAAKQALDQITQERDSYITSIQTQYSGLPDIGEDSMTQVADYKKALEEKIKATEKYMATLEKLRALGLDDTTYRRLLSEGVKDQGFADQILAGGKDSVDEINKLDAQLLASATGLANEAAANLYKAGVDAAQGLVDGLKAKQGEIQLTMDAIAEGMVNAIKRKLGIKSPSRIFAEVGKFSAQGVVEGLRGSTRLVGDAAANVGDEAVSRMRSSFDKMTTALGSEINFDPTITPVLDLTQVRKTASKLDGIINTGVISPTSDMTSYLNAAAVAQEVASAKASQDSSVAGGNQIHFEQNNYSPEALSDVEIYRQTRNQLSQVKSVLGLPG